MKTQRTPYRRFAPVILAATVALLPAIGFGVREAMRNQNNNVRQWLPEGFKETREYDWFLEQFGSEEMAMVSWGDCSLEDERVEQVAEGLRPYTLSEGDADTLDGPYLFKRVMTPGQVIDQLASEPLNLSPEAARARLRGSLFGPDGQTSALVVMVSEAGAADRHAALDVVYRVAEDQAGIARSELRVGGPTVDSVALDSESQKSRYLLAGVSVVLALGLAWICLRKLNLVATVFATALLCGAISVAMVHYTGGEMSLVMGTMPTLIYVLAISGAIHLTNYYKDAVNEHGPLGAVERAVRAAWLPCTLTAGTTAVGLGSLAVSQVVPVKMFGIYSALGVVCSLPVLFLFLPAALSLWPLRRDSVRAAAPPSLLPGLSSSWSQSLAAVISQRQRLITVCGILAIVLVGGGVLRLETSVKLLNLFSPDSRIIQDYGWLEKHVGPLVPVEVVVRFDSKDETSIAERMRLVGEVQKTLGEIDKVDGTMSAATFAPRVPSGGGLQDVMKRGAMEKPLNQQREQLVATNYLRDAEDAELWRVSARVEALNSLDYGQFMSQLQTEVEPALDSYRETYDGRVDAVYTGVVPLVYKAQRELLNDLTHSFIAAFVLIGIVMVVMMRSVGAGLLTMLPNIFPAVLVFGVMGWSGRLCDIGSMMTASVALGIAVDDTIHYLSWFKRGLSEGMSRRESIGLAYRRCAGAMIQTTVVCGLGLLVFSLSSFVPTARFATLMFTLLVAALIGDLLFLPGLLAGPGGRLFEKRGSAKRRGMRRRATGAAVPPQIGELAPSTA